jgi:hypothetical protein
MYQLFRKLFVPHPENDHRPHILRTEAVLVMLAAVFAVEVLFLAHALVLGRSGMLAAVITNVLVDRTNETRLTDGLTPLTVNPLLARAAQLKADDMAAKGYFAHTSPDGVTPWHWFAEAGYRYLRAGENLAVNFVDSEDVIQAWMDSPKHRENMVNAGYAEIGIATAKGTYQGKETIFIVQLFGSPVRAETVGAANISPSFRPVAILNEAGEPEALPENVAVAGATLPEVDNAVVVSGLAEVAAQAPPVRVGEVRRYAKFLDRLLSSPRAAAQAFAVALATLVALALMFVFFLRAHVPHPHLLVNGIAFLIVLGTVVLLNQYVALASARIF